MAPKRFVYLLRSATSGRPYVGLTSDFAARLAAHNAGQNPSTARHKPWELVTLVEFGNESTAARFERYLKSGSGVGAWDTFWPRAHGYGNQPTLALLDEKTGRR